MCSFFAEEKMNLDLEIEDVVEFNDVELQNYKISLFDNEVERDFLWMKEENDF